MNILLTFDAGYAPHAAALIESIIRHCPEKLNFWILYVDLDVTVIDTLRTHYKDRVRTMNFLHIDSGEFEPFKDVRTLSHIPHPENVLLRLFCDRIPCDDWILYLDCDMLVMQDVRDAASTVDDTKILYAVTEFDASYKERDLLNLSEVERTKNGFLSWLYEAYYYRAFKYLDLKFDGRYFNAGLMLINLKLWRENNIGKQALDYILKNPESCFATDQDALNHLLSDEYVALAPKWNNITKEWGVFTNYSEEELREACVSPAVCHYAGGVKPWHYISVEQDRKLYEYYRKSTPWPMVAYTDRTKTNVLKKKTKIFIKFCLKPFFSERFMKRVYSLLYVDKGTNRYWGTARLRQLKR